MVISKAEAVTSRATPLVLRLLTTGMRASGSHDVVFHNCFVPDNDLAVGQVGPTSMWGSSPANIVPVLGQSAVFLGIAEVAHEETIAIEFTAPAS
jgi:alkylation response protein AidB-like acyl-CoA dehydrogenase